MRRREAYTVLEASIENQEYREEYSSSRGLSCVCVRVTAVAAAAAAAVTICFILSFCVATFSSKLVIQLAG